jgi:hypothetical protein
VCGASRSGWDGSIPGYVKTHGKGDKETTGQALGSNVVDFGVDSNGHVTNVQASARFVADRNQVVGDQGEQFRTDRRGLDGIRARKRGGAGG